MLSRVEFSFFFSSRRRHTRYWRDWSSDVCSSDLEGGYLAAIYENVYLDLSYGIPLLSYGEMLTFTRQALGVAPISKLLYSSDGIGVPELHWMSAIDGRHVLGQALEDLVAHTELTIPEAEAAGEDVLRWNAIRLYRLS